MPPKRKRAEDTKAAQPASSTRATRSSTRKAGATKAAAKPSDAEDGTSPESEPVLPVKKPKTTKATKTAGPSKAKTTVAKGKAVLENKDQVAPPPTQRLKAEEAPQPTNGIAVVKATPTGSTQKYETHTPAKALATFEKYADEDEPEVIGPESFGKLCEDANIPMDGSQPLLVAWQMNAAEMGKITKEEWVKGTDKLKIVSLQQLSIVTSDLDSLIIQGQTPLKKPAETTTSKGKRTDEPYDRTSYWQHAADPKAAFQNLYSYCFSLAKPSQARNIEMETATALWSVLLAPQYPIIEEIVKFINDKGSYRGVNKDLWSMTLDFCKTVKPDLSGYEADGAWPTLLDEFVTWKKETPTTA